MFCPMDSVNRSEDLGSTQARLISEKNEANQCWVPWLPPYLLSLSFHLHWEVVLYLFHLPLVPVCSWEPFWLSFTPLTSSSSSWALALLAPSLHAWAVLQYSYPIPASSFCAPPLCGWAQSGVPCWSTLAFCHVCYDSPWNVSSHIGPDSLQLLEILALDISSFFF